MTGFCFCCGSVTLFLDHETLMSSAVSWAFYFPSNAQNTRNEISGGQNLRVCPRDHQAVVLHAISPISMKLCKFKGSTPKLKQTNWSLFWFFPGEDRPPPRFFLVFTKEIASKWVKCKKLFLRWFLTDSSESLHTYCYTLS